MGIMVNKGNPIRGKLIKLIFSDTTQPRENESLDFVCTNLDDIVTPIDVDELEKLLIETQYDEKRTNKLIEGFRKGFDIGYRGPTNRTDLSNNLPIHIGSHEEIWEKLMKEVRLNRYAGPFEEIPYDNYVQSPIGLVPKDNGKKMRLIFHLSYDFKRADESEKFNSINHHTPQELCTVRYRDLDYAVRACLDLLKDYKNEQLWYLPHKSDNITIYYTKTDVVSAFRILPI